MRDNSWVPHRRLPLLCLLGVLALGCEDEQATQLVVVVDSDLGVPGELSRLGAQALTPDGEPVSTHEFELVGDPAEAGPARFVLPLSFGVVPAAGDADRRVRVQVAGFAPGGSEPLVERRAVTGFVEGQSLLLPMFLARACIDTTCPEGQTCTREGCRDEEVSVGSLRSIDPGQELSFFDGGADGGPSDGGPDAPDGAAGSCPSSCMDGCLDVSCPAGETCSCNDEPCNCRLTCEADACDALCRKATCLVDGRDGGDLQVRCENDSDCRVDARGSSAATVQCEGAGRCDVDCRGATDCELQCSPGSSCLLRCADAASCRITSCTGMQRACDGDVLVCGRSCP